MNICPRVLPSFICAIAEATSVAERGSSRAARSSRGVLQVRYRTGKVVKRSVVIPKDFSVIFCRMCLGVVLIKNLSDERAGLLGFQSTRQHLPTLVTMLIEHASTFSNRGLGST